MFCLALGFVSAVLIEGCTNLLVSKGSTTDGSTIIAYSADDGDLMGDISNFPAGKHNPGDLRPIYSWDFGTYLGSIPQPAQTYNVVGNTNEFQLTIGETTFGGLQDLNGENGKGICNATYGCIDYGQLIWVTLQRARTAKEAITVMDELMQTYGYASHGESFSIADTEEVWLMEVIGKGGHEQGSIWVATRVPDGSVCAHANQARTRTFSRSDPANVRYAKDVVDFPRKIGLYNGTDEDFSFSDIVDPVSFSGARFCEARVFSFFSAVADKTENIGQYLDYVQGYNLTNRMPLFVKVANKLGVNDTMWHMRNHYEGTWLDPRFDVGAQGWHLPNRLGEGLIWEYEGSTYVNERPIGTHYAAWNFIGVQRASQKYSVIWFGMDDSSFSLHTPIYGITDRMPAAWSCGNCTGREDCKASFGLPGTMQKFSMQSQHWVQNLISNYIYSRYDQIAPVARARLVQLEGDMFERVAKMDKELVVMSPEKAAAAAANFSFNAAQNLHNIWADFFGELFSSFVDGYRATPDPSNEVSQTKKTNPHFSDDWKKRIVADVGPHQKVPASWLNPAPGARDKLQLKALSGTSN